MLIKQCLCCFSPAEICKGKSLETTLRMFDSDKYNTHAHTCTYTHTNTHLFLYIFSHRNSWSGNNYEKFVMACTWLMYTRSVTHFLFRVFNLQNFIWKMTQHAAGENTNPNNLFYCRGILPHTEIALPQTPYNVY